MNRVSLLNAGIEIPGEGGTPGCTKIRCKAPGTTAVDTSVRKYNRKNA